MYNGQHFCSFGKSINIKLRVKEGEVNVNLVKMASLLSEGEKLGTYEECYAVLVECKEDVNKAREQILRRMGMISTANIGK